MLEQSEAELQRDVLSWLAIYNILHWRMPIGAVLHRKGKGSNVKEFRKPSPIKGFPDIAGVLSKENRGMLFALELKSKKGRLTQDQKIWIAKLELAGAKAAVIKSLDDLIESFTRWGEI